MPQRKSAKKELKKNLKRRKLNLARKKKIKEAIKAFKKAVEAKNIEEAQKKLNIAYKILDKVSSKRTIHPNKAARQKSKLARMLQVLQQQNASS